MRRAVAAGAVVVAALLAGGCSGGDGPGDRSAPTEPAMTEPAEPAATTGGAGDDVSVNRVLAGLDGVMGDLQRILVRERRITPEVTDRLQAIYTGPELLNQIDAFKADVAQGLGGYRPTPGNRLTVVSRLVTAGRDCVFAEVKRDYSPVSSQPPQAPATLYVILVPKHSSDDPNGHNPTAWAMLYDGVQDDGSAPEDVCR